MTARTGDRDDGCAEISAFILEKDTPGFSIGRLEEKLGLHASATGELLFENAKIPADQILGSKGDGWKTFLKTLDGGRISIGAMAVGLSQAALDASIVYARERKQFGRPIGSFQGVAFMIADMATEIEAARQMVYRAAWLKDQGQDYARRRRAGASFSHAKCHNASPTGQSRSTAATATLRSTKSSASCATPSSPSSAKAPARSSGS